MSFQIRSQEYARIVYELVSNVNTPEQGFNPKDYGRICRKFPLLVMSNGLLQTLAFVESKSGDDKPLPMAFRRFKTDFERVAPFQIAGLRDCGVEEYIRHSKTAVEIGHWFKRYAESLIGVDNE